MFNFYMTPFGRLFFMKDGDQGGTSGDGNANAGEGGGSANDQNSQDQTSGDGAGEGNQGSGFQTGTQVSGGQQSQSSAGSDQSSNSGNASAGENDGKNWQKEYNKLAGTIRTDSKKVQTSQANEAKANQAVATVTEERDKLLARAEAAELETTRVKLILESGIPGNLADLVTGQDEETIKAQIEKIQSTLIGSGSTTTSDGNQNQSGAGSGSGTGDGNGSSGSGDGQSQAGAGTGDGNQQSGSQDGSGNQSSQTSDDKSGSGEGGHIPPKPAGDANKDWLQKFSEADGSERHKMMRDVREGRVDPGF